MGLVTYVLLSTLIAGLRGEYRPELLGYTGTIGLIVMVTELIALKLGCYILSISSQSQLFDLIAYSGYKFVGIIVTIAIAQIFNSGQGTGGWLGWTVFIYTFMANSFFLVSFPHTAHSTCQTLDFLTNTTLPKMRSLKYVLLPENSHASGGTMQTDSRAKRNQRTQFLFFYSFFVQLFFMWVLTRA
jgi:hypothetical protein